MGVDSNERLGSMDKDKRACVGEGAVIKGAILDKNVRIGQGAKIINKKGVDHEDGDCYFIRDGIVVIPKNTIIPPGTVI